MGNNGKISLNNVEHSSNTHNSTLRDVYGEAQLIVTQGIEEGVRGPQIKIFKDREKYRKLPYLYYSSVHGPCGVFVHVWLTILSTLISIL